MYRVFLFIILMLIVSGKSFPQEMLNEIINISRSPVTIFKDRCAKCHGLEGKAYGKDFGKMEDAELKKIIRQMMVGPAQLKPEDIEVDAMYAYNISLREQKPFAVVLNSKSFLEGKDNSLLINLSPDAELNLENEKQVKIEKDQNNYKIFYDAGKIKRLEIVITKNKSSSSFYFPDRLWSE